MTRFVCIVIIALSFLMLFQVLPVTGQEEQKQKEWTGTLPDGKILTKKSLKNFLADHKKWLETNERAGKKADLTGANLSEVILTGAKLYDADLRGADLIGANLRGANLYIANLSKANLSGADLIGTNLNKAKLIGAKLRKANLSGADLSEADLSGADLSEANLHIADLSEAVLREANLGGAIFQPKLESIPKIKEIGYAQNLSELTYWDRPKSLVALREEFKKGGMRKQEREVTRAIKHTQMLNAWKKNSSFKKIQAVFNYVFFELTCQYGMKPSRPLIILMCLIPFFSINWLFP